MTPIKQKLTLTPLPIFATVMGTAGLSLAWRRAEHALGVPGAFADVLFWFALVVFLAAAAAYGVRIADRGRLAADLGHPMKATFLTTITVSLVLLAATGREVLPGPVAEVLWWAGALGHLAGMLATMRLWMSPKIGIGHVTPAWFIPVVGNVVVPLGGVPLGHVGMSLFSFSVGIVMWLGILPLVLHRLFLHDTPMPPKFLPTVAILLAPPAVSAGSAYLLFDGGKGEPGALAKILAASAGAFLLLALTRAMEIIRLPFALPHWAMSFPAAAMASTTLLMEPRIGLFFLAFATILITGLWARTVVAVARGGVFVAE